MPPRLRHVGHHHHHWATNTITKHRYSRLLVCLGLYYPKDRDNKIFIQFIRQILSRGDGAMISHMPIAMTLFMTNKNSIFLLYSITLPSWDVVFNFVNLMIRQVVGGGRGCSYAAQHPVFGAYSILKTSNYILRFIFDKPCPGKQKSPWSSKF